MEHLTQPNQPQTRPLDPGQTVETFKRADPSLGLDIMGSDPIVQLDIGGHKFSGDDNIEPSTLSILRPNRDDPDFNDLKARAEQQGVPVGTELMLVTGKDGSTLGASFMSPTGTTVLGREGNTRWFSYGVQTDEKSEPKWTPFDDTVSRQHVTIVDRQDRFAITGATRHAHTSVRSSDFVEKLVIAESDLNPSSKRQVKAGGFLAKVAKKVVRSR